MSAEVFYTHKWLLLLCYYDSFLGTKKKKLNARPAGTKEHLFTAKDEENVKTKLTNPNSFSPVIIIAKP